MALRLEAKSLVAEVAEELRPVPQSVVAAYRGLSVAQLTDLRPGPAPPASTCSVENTLARRAVSTPFECVGEAQGPADPRVLAGRPGRRGALIKVRQGPQKLVPTLVSLGGTVLSAKDLERSRITADEGAGARAAHKGAQRRPSASSCARSPSLTRSSCGRLPRSGRSRPRWGDSPESTSGRQHFFFRSHGNGCMQQRDLYSTQSPT